MKKIKKLLSKTQDKTEKIIYKQNTNNIIIIIIYLICYYVKHLIVNQHIHILEKIVHHKHPLYYNIAIFLQNDDTHIKHSAHTTLKTT